MADITCPTCGTGLALVRMTMNELVDYAKRGVSADECIADGTRKAIEAHVAKGECLD